MIGWEIEFEIPIFRTRIELKVVENVKTFVKSEYNDDIIEHDAILYNDNSGNLILILDRVKGVKENTLVHESFHITCAIMRYIGSKLSMNSEENYAYTIDYVYKLLRMKTIKLKQQENGSTDKSEEIQSSVPRSTKIQGG